MFTMDSPCGSFDFADDAADELHHAAHQYLLELGWTTIVHGGELVLELDDDIWGLQMPTGLAAHLVSALHRMHLSCPVVDLPGRQKIVLVESAERTDSAPPFPRSVSELPPGDWVPLPPTVTARGPVRWMSRHEPHGLRRPSAHMIADTLTRLVGSSVDRA